MAGWGFACCPSCEEPLLSCFETPKKEFVCLGCGRWWEFLSPLGKPDDTPGLQARYDELHALYKAGDRGPGNPRKEPKTA